jgi:hypothetical protein
VKALNLEFNLKFIVSITLVTNLSLVDYYASHLLADICVGVGGSDDMRHSK